MLPSVLIYTFPVYYSTVVTLLQSVLKTNNFIIFSYIFVSIYAITVSSIRWEIGTDWNSYKWYFENHNSLTSFLHYPAFEIGYKMFVWLCKQLTNDYSIFLAITAIATIIMKSVSYYKLKCGLIGIIAYAGVFKYDMAPVRQDLSLSIALIGIVFVFENKAFFGYLVIFIAGFFHSTAFLLIPSLLFPKTSIILFLIIATVAFSNPELGIEVVKTLAIENSFLLDRINLYTSGFDVIQPGVNYEIRNFIRIIERILCTAYFMSIYKKSNCLLYSRSLYLYSIGTIILITTIFEWRTFLRFVPTFSVLEPFLVGHTLQYSTNKKQLYLYMIFAAYYTSKLLFSLNGFNDLFFPYRTVL